MKVKVAVQVFSTSVAAGMSTYISLGALSSCAAETEKMDVLFDLLNSSSSLSRESNKPFIGTAEQLQLITEYIALFEQMQAFKGNVKVTNSIRNFRCWRVTLNGLLLMWEDLGRPIIFTCWLQQDSLEKFVGTVRQQCGNARNPTPIQFKRAFKKLFFMNYFHYTVNLYFDNFR